MWKLVGGFFKIKWSRRPIHRLTTVEEENSGINPVFV